MEIWLKLGKNILQLTWRSP